MTTYFDTLETRSADERAADLATALPQQIARAKRQAGAVRHQIPHAELRGDIRVGHLEFGDEIAHRIVPAELAFIHQHGERRGGEGLAD